VLTGALPGGWLAARVGVKRTVLFGLGLMVAASLVFAFARSVVVLDIARFAQGLGGAASWAGALGWLIGAAPRERRGELIGTAMGVAIGGALFGPVIGAAAHALGQEGVFTAVAAAGLALMTWAGATHGAPPPRDARLRTLAGALREEQVLRGMWLMIVPALMFGTIGVLVPLRLDELGAGATAIALVFLVSAALESAVSPLVGRLSDRHGRLLPSLAGLTGGAVFMALLPWPHNAWLLAATVVLAAPVIGLMWAPAMAMMSDGAETLGLEQGFAFALTNVAWAVGQTSGAAGSARLADATSDALPYLLLCVTCAVTVTVLRRAAARPAVV
jgi:MFS family permease